MNYIVCPVRNNLHLTKRAVKTFLAQDIGNICVLVINNGSSDGTAEWLATRHDVLTTTPISQWSVAQCWNYALRNVFSTSEYALVVNNDVELRPDTYRLLVEDGGGFVTAVGTRDPKKIESITTPDPAHKRPHPDFSAFLIRREVYEKVGPFDENFKIAFCEDGDYDLRMYKAGIRAYCLDLPFLHHGSMTVKNADIAEQNRIRHQADLNREYFKHKWGFGMGSPEYYAALDKGGPDPTL